jgi:hypothetical protein
MASVARELEGLHLIGIQSEIRGRVASRKRHGEIGGGGSKSEGYSKRIAFTGSIREATRAGI